MQGRDMSPFVLERRKTDAMPIDVTGGEVFL